jgi:hypothetical protein
MPSLDVNVRDFAARLSVLEQLVDGIDTVPIKFQKILGELVMLRLFSLLEAHLQSLCMKIVCGAPYLDGTRPTLLVKAPSAASAILQMRTLNRAKTLDLSWTTCTAIKKNIEFSVDTSDPIFATFAAYDASIDEMRLVRNHIAHGNADTRRKFRPVVKAHYGAYVPSITPGVLLLSRRHSPSILKRYLIQCRIAVRDIARA